MKIAMKAKDTAKLNTIRLIRSSFSNAAIDLRTEKLSDEQVRGVVYSCVFEAKKQSLIPLIGNISFEKDGKNEK